MAKITRSEADGWFQISLGAAQIQISPNYKGSLNITHSATIPTENEGDFQLRGFNYGIEVTLGSEPCWVKVIGDGPLTFSYADIS